MARLVADNDARIGVSSSHDNHRSIVIETYNDRDRAIMLSKRPWLYEKHTSRNRDFLVDHMNNIIESDIQEAMYYLNQIK